MAKGDAVEVVVDMGGGMSRPWVIKATRDGRRVEVTRSRTETTVTELTRGGKPVRTAIFQTGRLLAVVERPAGETDEPSPRRRRQPAADGQLDLTEQVAP